METYDCGHPIPEEKPPALIAAGGWCAPSEVLYDIPRPTSCSDCEARMYCIMQLGIDPGPNGSYLRVKRGGIRYGGTDA